MTQATIRIKLRHAEYYGLQGVFDELYAKSKAGETFGSLMSIIASERNIMLAFRNIKGNKGSYTAGTDGKDIGQLAEMDKEEFVSAIQRKFTNYQPKTVKRVEIPKPNGKIRPLGIPCIVDRMVQQCILQVLEPICEAKFHERSHGFRPGHSAENAIGDCYRITSVARMHYAVEVDIEGFFDNVDHRKLMQQLWSMGIRDTRLLMIIKAMLKAPIRMPDGEIVNPSKGTPQGGILSPLLANVVLNELDWWIASQWEMQYQHTRYAYKCHVNANGSLNKGKVYEALKTTRLKAMYIVRYADDFKIFCRNREDAEKTFIATKQWLKQRLKLDVSPEKSRVTNLERQYCEFLGFKIKVRQKGKKKSGKPRWVTTSHVSDKAVRKIQDELRETLEQIRRAPDLKRRHQKIDAYNAQVVGIQNYYSMATNVCEDLHKVTWVIQNRINQHLATSRNGEWKSDFLKKRFGKSKMVRWVGEKPIMPIGYVRFRAPRSKLRAICMYTEQGREAIHSNLKLNPEYLLYLANHPIGDRSVEYNDNRLSRYTAQLGCCAATGWQLMPEEVHCHHVIPRFQGGSDKYENLVILHEDVHVLVHAKNVATIAEYVQELGITPHMVGKVNKLRVAAGLQPIEATTACEVLSSKEEAV